MVETFKKTQFKGVLLLLLTAFIWGVAFVAQSVGMEDVEAFTFSGIRTLLGAAALLPVILIRHYRKNRNVSPAKREKLFDRKTVKYGAVLSIVFCAAGNFQQFAFNYTSSGKIAFITALYMFFVPFLGLFLKKRVPLITWICVMFGFVGLYFLCMDSNDIGAVNKGDVLAFICAVIFAVHILLTERYAPEVDCVKLACVQFAFAGVMSCILMFIFEEPRMEGIMNAAVPLLYAGVLSCGVAYTFQVIGQKYAEATVASLAMCMESVFGVLAAAVLLNELLTARELTGCAVMFAAIVVSQFSDVITDKFKKWRKASG